MAAESRSVVETDHEAEIPVDRSGYSQSGDAAATAFHDARLELIDRIACSEPFQKSTRLPQLIRYLALHSLQDDRAGLTEQAIGRNVFDKPKDFHPAEDSSVRVYMRQLRLRLHEFYQSAGRDEPIVVEIPKGGYALVFHPAEVTPPLSTPQAVASLPPATPISSASTASLRPGVVLPWLLFACAFCVAVVGWYRALHPAVGWVEVPWPLNQVVHDDRPTTVVLADASYSLRMLWKGDFTLDDYIHRERIHHLIEQLADSRDLPLLRYMESAQITSIADAHASAVLVGLSGPSWKNLNFRSAKDLNPSMLADGDFIFVGSKTSNPWVELYESRLNFPIEISQSGDRYVRNRVPDAGEQATYTVTGATGSSGEDYATISLFANTGGHGSMLLIQGVRLEGTEAAIRFLADAQRRDELARRLTAANDGKLPRYFEVLLHAHSVAGSAVSIECVTVRPVAG